MKRIKALLFILVLFLITPIVVNADCESDFKEVEDQFKISYVYNKDTDDFTITMVSPDRDRFSWVFHSQEELKNAVHSVEGQKVTTTINNYKNDQYDYRIAAVYSGCKGQTLKKGTLQLKKYNPYADSPLCEGNEDFVLCQKDYDKAISEDEFESRIEAYEESKKDNTSRKSSSESKKSDTQEKESIFAEVREFAEEHIAVVIIAAVIVIALIITAIIMIKKSIKSRRLE